MTAEGIAHGRSDDLGASWLEANRFVERGLTLLTDASRTTRADPRSVERNMIELWTIE
jgi:hypothetical protein